MPNQTTKSWYWNTQFGITTYDLKTNSNYVLCVRGNPVMAATEFTAKNAIKVYPNPASNFVLLSFPNELNLVQIEMTNALGQIIYANEVKPISNEYKIDIQGFLDGIYFINIMNDNSKQTFKLLVKNN